MTRELDRTVVYNARLRALLQDMSDIIKDCDGGNPETKTGWASEEMLDLWMRVRAEIERLAALVKTTEDTCRELRKFDQAVIQRLNELQVATAARAELAQIDNERLRAALHNIGIGGNGEHNWTLDEVRAVAWDALEPKP